MIDLRGGNAPPPPPITEEELKWTMDEAGVWLVKSVLGADGATGFKFEPIISEELRSMLEARRSAMCGGLPVLGIDSIGDVLSVLRLARGESSPLTRDETVTLTLPIELEIRLENSLSLAADGVDANKALGLKRGRGNKTRGIERLRRWGLAMAFELMLIERPEANRGTLAEAVAASGLGTIGRSQPFGPRYIQLLHQVHLRGQSYAGRAELELAMLAGMIALIEEDLRARYEK